jgi:hypothetical protein
MLLILPLNADRQTLLICQLSLFDFHFIAPASRYFSFFAFYCRAIITSFRLTFLRFSSNALRRCCRRQTARFSFRRRYADTPTEPRQTPHFRRYFAGFSPDCHYFRLAISWRHCRFSAFHALLVSSRFRPATLPAFA